MSGAGWWSFDSEDIGIIIRSLTKCWESRGCKRKCTSFLRREFLPGHCDDRKFSANRYRYFFPGGYCYFTSNFHRIEYRVISMIVIPVYALGIFTHLCMTLIRMLFKYHQYMNDVMLQAFQSCADVSGHSHHQITRENLKNSVTFFCTSCM